MTIEEARDVLRTNVRRLRKSRGLTQAQLAAKMDVSQASVAQLEAGTRMPSFEALVKLAEVLNVPPDLLLRAEVFSDVA